MSEEELTVRITIGEQCRSLPETEFLREIAELERARFVGALPGRVTIEAIDNRGRVCWRGYYRNVEAVARDLCGEPQRTKHP